MEEEYTVEPRAGTSKRTPNSAKKPAAKKKVVRRDPDKRRLQNRLAQKTYREKQRKRIQELERRAESSGAIPDQDASPPNDLQVAVKSIPVAVNIPGQTVDPTLLQTNPRSSASASQTTSEDAEETWEEQDLLSNNFDQWLTEVPAEDPSIPPVIFFNCGCPILHVPVHPSSILLPVIPDPRMNTLRIDIICSIQALIENCLQVGITRTMFCSDDSISPFYRPQIDAPEERANLVGSVQRGFRGLHFDLRPTRTQITMNHHPFMDAIPFKDVRDNLIMYQDEIDEDEFFHDSLNHMTCWGSVKGAHTGSPWDSRSWEASEEFLQKWWAIVGGEDGELTRQSRWWRSLRGERVTEVL